MILVTMLSHHLSVVVSTVSHDAIWWLSLAMLFNDCGSRCCSVVFGTFGNHFLFRSELLWWTSLHSFSIDDAQLMFSSSLRCSCSRTNYSLSQRTSRYIWHLRYARYNYHLRLLVALAGFHPGMLFTRSPGWLAVTCLGIHIVVFPCWLLATYACWLCQWCLPSYTHWLISSCDSLQVSALQGAFSQHFRYSNCLQ